MPKFFVGQRVRILYSHGWPELNNQEGRVVALDKVVETGPGTGEQGYHVAPDLWGTYIAPYLGLHGGSGFCPRSEQLEPILPEGHKAGDFSYEELLDHLKEISVPEVVSHESA